MPKRIIKNIVQTSVVALQQIKESWKSITKRKQLKTVLQENAKLVLVF